MKRFQKIAFLLKETSTAHRDYEISEMSGETDPDWPGWYADYLVDNGLLEILKKEISRKTIAQFLIDADQEFKTHQPEMSWMNYYANKLLENYG